jgi:hypothetical protein
MSAASDQRGAPPADTSGDAYLLQIEAYRAMGGPARCAVGFRLAEFAQLVAETGIRTRHPEYDDERVRKALFRLRLGDELMRTIWPNDDLVAP